MSEFQNIYLLKHRNYYERKVKRYDTIAQYTNKLAVYQNINFPIGNGIDVNLTVNYDLNNGQPDYALVEDSDTGNFTRWYVLTSTVVRNGQCLLTLHRDVVADNLDEILNATSYIEKAQAPISSPLIYANENITCNKIAKSQVVAANSNSVNYYYIYLSKTDNNNANQSTTTRQTTVDSKTTTETIVETINAQTVNWTNKSIVVNTSSPTSSEIVGTYSSIQEFYKSVGLMNSNNEFKYLLKSALVSWYHTGSSRRTTFYGRQVYALDGSIYNDKTINKSLAIESNIYTGKLYGSNKLPFFNTETIYADYYTKILNGDSSLKNKLRNAVYNSSDDYLDFDIYKNFNNNYVGKYIAIKDSSGDVTYYRINNNTADIEGEWVNTYPDKNNEASLAIMNIMQNINNELWLSESPSETAPTVLWYNTPVYLEVFKSKNRLAYSVSQYTTGNLTLSFPSNRNTTTAGYDVIAIPYVDHNGNTLNGNIRGYNINYLPDMVKMIINKLSITYGSSVILDVQLLPVTPNKALEDVNGQLYTNQLTLNRDYTWAMTSDGSYRIPVFFLKNLNLKYSYSVDVNQLTDDEKVDPIKFKTAYITKHWELVADNHSTTYELPIMYNNVSNYITVNYNVSLFPYNPYIRLDIKYNNLNGADVSLARGLVLSGNYSETQLTNAWTEYQYNNVNYNSIFNNQIAYQQAQNSYNNSNAWLDIGTNIGTSAAGLVAGAVTGGTAGLAATGLSLSGAANIATSIVKQKRLESMQQTAIDYSKDQFALQLGNIQNKANVINKLTSYNIDNTVFPTIVIYDATDVEKTAIEAKLKYNGMTIGVIDKLTNYLPLDTGYIKAKIMYIDIQASAEYVESIADEMNRGIIYER